MSNLLTALFEGQRQKALAFLYLQPKSRVHVREIARSIGSHAGSLHRELNKLSDAGLLIRETQGNQVMYGADASCPIFQELSSIFRKISGIPMAVKNALLPIADSIHAAFIFGSFARGTQHAGSDIDVFVIGTPSFESLVLHLHDLEKDLTREINPCLYSPSDFQAKLALTDGFLSEVIAQPKLFLFGSDDDLRQPGIDRAATEDSRQP